MKKILSFLLILSAFVIGHEAIFSKTNILEVPELLASSRSKEFCSCFFLLKNKEKSCLNQVLKGYPLFKYKLKKDSVSFTNPFYSSKSNFLGDKYGCQLQ